MMHWLVNLLHQDCPFKQFPFCGVHYHTSLGITGLQATNKTLSAWDKYPSLGSTKYCNRRNVSHWMSIFPESTIHQRTPTMHQVAHRRHRTFSNTVYDKVDEEIEERIEAWIDEEIEDLFGTYFYECTCLLRNRFFRILFVFRSSFVVSLF